MPQTCINLTDKPLIKSSHTAKIDLNHYMNKQKHVISDQSD
jgi:hypothetical protein